jgi:hypothetical protein
MKDKKRACIAVLFHQILPLINFAKFEFFQKEFFYFLILYERGKGKMSFKALKNQCLIVYCLLLDNLNEVLIDFIVVDCSQCTHLASLSFALKDNTSHTSSLWPSPLMFSSLRSVRELKSLLSFRSRFSI